MTVPGMQVKAASSLTAPPVAAAAGGNWQLCGTAAAATAAAAASERARTRARIMAKIMRCRSANKNSPTYVAAQQTIGPILAF
jgi:hypothetical protein